MLNAFRTRQPMEMASVRDSFTEPLMQQNALRALTAMQAPQPRNAFAAPQGYGIEPSEGLGSQIAPDPNRPYTINGSSDPFIQGVLDTAEAIGADPVDLLTVISYETGGTLDPLQRGPTTQWGQHRGLIQFGEPQARQYGVNWDDPLGSQLGPDGAIARYFRQNGYQPGMGLLDLYSTVNAGAPGLYNRSDANNGGAPGTVRDKVNDQMSGHRARALSLLGLT